MTPRLILLALLLALSGIATVGAQAPTQREQRETEAAKKLEQVRAQIRALTQQQRQLEGERGEAARAVREADQQVGAAVRALRQTEAAIATREAELSKLERDQAALEQRLSSQRETLAALVRSAYALGRHEQLKVLLAQDRVADLARAMAYHRYLQADRSERIRGLMDELQALADLTRQVEARRAELLATRNTQQRQLAELEGQRAQRRALVAELDARHKDSAARIAALGRDERALMQLLERLRDALADVPRQLEDGRPFAQRRGALPWPLSGALLTGFGGKLPDGRASEGWLIAGTAGAEVRAISHGRVAFADWLKGYGLIVIVDHGDGWMSLYAHNDALLRDAGDWVRAGDPLASVGSSGGQGRAALYFELRQNSKPVDPRNWLQRR